MKVIALTFTTLFLAVAAQSNFDYRLQCTRQEVGIRWPSYYSHSEYYICQREGGKQMTLSCPPGELFTFVLQMCTTPNKYIPPPPMDVLPTSSPQGFQPQPEVEHKPMFPKPAHPGNNDNQRPPIIISENPIQTPNWEIPEHKPPMVTDVDEPQIETEEEITGPPSKPLKPIKPQPPVVPSKPKPQPPAKQEQAPLPPTPAPTPPVVKQTGPPSKQSNKKPPAPPAKKETTQKKAPQIPAEAKKKMPQPPPSKSRAPVPPSKS